MVESEDGSFEMDERACNGFECSRSAGSNLINDGSGILPLRVLSISVQGIKKVGDSGYEILLFPGFWYARIALVVQTCDDSLELVDSDTTVEGISDCLLQL